jgi:hypothetical protein
VELRDKVVLLQPEGAEVVELRENVVLLQPEELSPYNCVKWLLENIKTSHK